ncbi:MAG: hypothetical protein IT477_10905 [Rhodanobacteraceae bacterium]|nr:hypothetical protein [Rhodanobacteraceae bacterium]
MSSASDTLFVQWLVSTDTIANLRKDTNGPSQNDFATWKDWALVHDLCRNSPAQVMSPLLCDALTFGVDAVVNQARKG